MRIFNLLPTLGFSALILAAFSPALSQDSIPIFPIVDFEANQEISTLQAYGGTYTDSNEFSNDSIRGNSILTTYKVHENPDSLQWVPGYQPLSITALKLGYRLGTVMLGCGTDPVCEYAPHVGFAISFSQTWDPLDLTGATHITFWAKGRDSLTVNVSVGMRDTVENLPRYSQAFKIDTTWKKYSIELKASEVFKLPTWVTQVPFEAARANAISFSINKGENAAHPDNAFFLDDIEIVNWVYTPYVDPTGIFGHGRKAVPLHGLQARFAGDVAFVRVPAALLGKTGMIEALDATGRKVGQAAFGPQALDVSLSVPGASAKSAGLYFRAITK
jgi:hypothetical protein